MPKGNSLADGAAKEAANGTCIMPLVPVLDLSQFDPEYSIAGLEKATCCGFDEDGPDRRKGKNKEGVILPPEPLRRASHEAFS